MLAKCGAGGALLYVPLELIKLWYAPGIWLLLQNMAVDPVVALVANAPLMKIERRGKKARELFWYNYDEGKIMVLPVEQPLIRHI